MSKRRSFACDGPIYITIAEEKERKLRDYIARRKKGGEEKKAMDSLFVFILTTLEIAVERKKLLD